MNNTVPVFYNQLFLPNRIWQFLIAATDIAAIVAKSFLKANGHILKTTYKEQFDKLMHILCTKFFASVCTVKKHIDIKPLPAFIKKNITLIMVILSLLEANGHIIKIMDNEQASQACVMHGINQIRENHCLAPVALPQTRAFPWNPFVASPRCSR